MKEVKHTFKTFKEQIAFENTLPDNTAYDSLSDPVNKVYETVVKVKICPTCGSKT